jgi:hypothetical protein
MTTFHDMRSASLAVIIASACKPEPDTTAEPAAPAPVEQSPAIECPAATFVRGAAPPKGRRVWCETEAGVSHGPFRSWWPDGQPKTEGTFRQGKAAGQWTSWYDDGQLRSRGRYEDGSPIGEWEKFNRDGTPAPAETKVEVAEEPKPSDPPVVIGIPICDLYIARYGACIDAKAPLAAKEAMLDAFRRTIEAWRQVAQGPGRDALEHGCKAAYDAVSKVATAWGCEM